MLEVRSTTKGFLPPRMTGAQRDSMVNPTPGLIIYCTDCMELQLFNDKAWTNFIGLPAIQGFQCGDSLTYGTQNYGTVLVGNRCWMSENLNIGTKIVGMASSNNAILEKYCYDDLTSNCTIYGALYRWDEMMQYTTDEGAQGICPTGWHIPTDDEFKAMEIALGMTQSEADNSGYRGTDQGSQLGGIDSLWTDGDLDQNVAFGTSNFDAIPGGSRSNAGNYSQLSNNNYIWTSSESDTNFA